MTARGLLVQLVRVNFSSRLDDIAFVRIRGGGLIFLGGVQSVPAAHRSLTAARLSIEAARLAAQRLASVRSRLATGAREGCLCEAFECHAFERFGALFGMASTGACCARTGVFSWRH